MSQNGNSFNNRRINNIPSGPNRATVNRNLISTQNTANQRISAIQANVANFGVAQPVGGFGGPRGVRGAYQPPRFTGIGVAGEYNDLRVEDDLPPILGISVPREVNVRESVGTNDGGRLPPLVAKRGLGK